MSAVVSDLDGLLLDTERAGLETFQKAAESLDLTLEKEIYLGCLGRKRDDGVRFIYTQMGTGKQTDKFIETWETLYKEQRLSEGILCKPGARALLEFLVGQSVPVVVATSSQRKSAEHKLSESGLQHLLSGLVTSSDVVTGKPDPEIFLKGAQLTGAEPANCLALEDSDIGVEAALAAGMQVIQVPDLATPSHNFESSRLNTLKSLHEVQHFIQHTISTGPAST